MWQKIVKASIYLSVFLLPLFWLSGSFEAFEFNKTYLLFVLVSIGLLAWLARMVFEDKKIRFKKGALDIFVLIFLLIMILNIVFSVDRVSTMSGFYGRFWPNLFGMILLMVFYFILANNVKASSEDKKDITVSKLVKVFLWSSFFVVLISYLSLFRVWAGMANALNLPNIMSYSTFNTVGGSLEQLAIFLSLVFVLLLSLIAFKKEKKSISRYILLVLIFLLLIFIDFWPAWLIISLSLIVFLVFAFWKRVFKEDVSRLSLSILFLIIAFVFLFSSPLKGVFEQISIFKDIPTELRLPQGTSWGIGVRGLKDNVVLGVGQSNFNYLFAKYKPDSFVQGPFWQLRFDRGANHISEMIGTTGILGILSYLALIGMFLLFSWKALNSKGSKIQFPLILVFCALFIAQFVFYQNMTLAFCFWLFLALGAISWAKPEKEKTVEFKDFPELGLIISILFWVILLGIGFLYFFMIKAYIADAYYKDYLVNPTENIARLEKAVRLNGSRADYHMALAGGYLRLISQEMAKTEPNEQILVGLVALSIREGRLATQIAPKRIAAQETLGVVYREIQGLAQGAREWGIKTFESAIETEPKNPFLYTELGNLLLMDEKVDEAKLLFNKALELREDFVPAGIQLALLDEVDGNIDMAIEKMEELVTKSPFSVDAHFQLGRMYFNEQYYTKAIGQFESVLTIFPNHSNARYSLGVIYENRGEIRKALEEFERVLEINPGNEIVLDKINSLTSVE